ncbi:MAG: hypothetical protein PHW69_09240, partial [Elusimicrobiaceae bacterium]|nr:hypothetical protein [Elusimicrobiaceae bacterium]
FAGAAQQGFFSVGEQLSVIMLVGAASLSNIFWKEISHAHTEGNIERTRDLYLKSTRTLYFATCCMAYFVIAFSGEAISVLLGNKYAAATACTALMIFATTYQAVGQINYAYLMATRKTKANMWLTIPSTVTSSALAYFFLAGPDYAVPGLGLGATGLALKAAVIQAALANLQMFYICRSNGWKNGFSFQLRYAAVFFALSVCAVWLTSFLPKPHYWFAVRLFAAGIIYGAGAIWYTCKMAGELGIDQSKFRTLFKELKNFADLRRTA